MNDINHSGVLGMKWGHRKTANSSDHTEARALQKKKTKHMSNAELEKLLKRTDLETRMKKIKPDHITSGTKKINAILETVGKLTATVTAVAALAKTGQKAYDILKKTKKVATVVKTANDYSI